MTAYTTEDPLQPDNERQGGNLTARELQDAEELWPCCSAQSHQPAKPLPGRARDTTRRGPFDELRSVGDRATSGSPPGEPRTDQGIDSQMSPTTATCRVEQTLASVRQRY
ncbi:hypothetical protein T12_3787 [Trichinella patagoniensis]|uniref:Uncharacterized protein n=1 Tax=Trichinella patagoniensis TaxID=990121 RepID=A0A0V1ACS0_9BILA|nr:hypothetical protein T12_3787 [Trichinella patagoniensis]